MQISIFEQYLKDHVTLKNGEIKPKIHGFAYLLVFL